MKIGFYGGAFNPIHYGHIKVAKQSKAKLKLDRIVLVPSGLVAHKEIKGSSAADRFAMVNLAMLEFGFFNVSPYEIREGRKHNRIVTTIETMTHMRSRFPKDELFFIVGVDEAESLDNWARPMELLELCNIAVVSRPGHSFDKVNEEYIQKMIILEMNSLDISSSTIRRMVSEGYPVEGLIPKDVYDYIMKTKLYGCHYDYYREEGM